MSRQFNCKDCNKLHKIIGPENDWLNLCYNCVRLRGKNKECILCLNNKILGKNDTCRNCFDRIKLAFKRVIVSWENIVKKISPDHGKYKPRSGDSLDYFRRKLNDDIQ